MNCAFCATGQMGFKRLLTAEEITDQWLFWQTYRPSHLVFMGMGEPFHNQAEVFKAMTDLHTYYQLGWRRMSVSTSGILPGILALAHEFPKVNLAISLHACIPPLREKLMPVTKLYPLAALRDTLLKYLQITPRQLVFEYLLLKDVNDTPTAFAALVDWLKPFPKRLIHLNLIRYNPTGAFAAPPIATVQKWKADLNRLHLSASIRKSLGTDIQGACGQLATQSKSKLL
jgi:23S rRNA (adenine2503-C2)-methyltransferase